MGFRSVMITQDYSVEWPLWIREKYPYIEWGPVAMTMRETKFYENTIFQDMYTALKEKEFIQSGTKFVAILLHECGGITRVQIDKTGVKLSEPKEWEQQDEVTHYYCYGCSDVEE